MDQKNKFKLAFILVVIFSISSSVYLQFQTNIYGGLISGEPIVETCIKEGFYLPDVNFVKEILRSIFNVAKV